VSSVDCRSPLVCGRPSYFFRLFMSSSIVYRRRPCGQHATGQLGAHTRGHLYGHPGAPGGPGGPGGPESPGGPGGPGIPRGPLAPGLPAGPSGPGGPVRI